ncbi:efflux RND transporter permease subunit [Aureivirga sp. CE67]|uniref:efflux RND transporter permease subunit n=1 Tax=Aureivirga sp. CE67 TaxID=1788983 RepID=UPI0018CBEBA6|nr:efflux RND transporter permease subunit [Aureivirga sp. CE67]
MLHKIIQFLIKHKLVSFLIAVIIIGWGVYTAPFNWKVGNMQRNPVAVDAIPDIGENQQIVYTKWAGRSPQDIEDQITYPLTTSLLGIPGVKTIRSSSMFGFSTIYIIFEEDVEFYWSRSRILEKLNALPANLLPPNVQPTLGPDATGLGQIFWYTLEGRDTDGNVTGGWDLQELRTIQDYYVKYGLSAAKGVSEVASIGGFVQEYQVDVNPNALQQYNISLAEVANAVKKSNKDVGAQTLEINNVEYIVRGLGYVESISDIENEVVVANENTPIRIKDIAKVQLGPAERRGILDKEGAEVVGGAVVARYGANPMEVIQNVKQKIESIGKGLPSKVLADGRTSQLTIVPFYDRTELIQETLETLNEALILEILITILVIVVMVMNLRASLLISSLLPISVLMVFIGMKLFHIDANIVALSGIAIAIGTIVDLGVILSENIIQHLEKYRNKLSINKIVYNATKEVSGAILTAVITTIVSFIPVFTMEAAEGKLFRPLAYTKTFALVAAILVTLFILPPFAAVLFKNQKVNKGLKWFFTSILVLGGIALLVFGFWQGIFIILLGIGSYLYKKEKISKKQWQYGLIGLISLLVTCSLALYWSPLGLQVIPLKNILFVGIIVFGILGGFLLFRKYYTQILQKALQFKLAFLTIPIILFVLGLGAWKSLGKEFMPALNEGSFLLMPTSLPHAGTAENKRVLQQLDMGVASIPEIETVVGKAGRIESALDPAPLSMYENIINYKSEYIQDKERNQLRFKVNDNGEFELKNGKTTQDNQAIEVSELIPDEDGKFFRQWRSHIKSPDDIWHEIVNATKLPGVTSAPKLQPIQTRLIMLQTGMRSPMGIKVKGTNLQEIENFGLELEKVLQGVKGVKPETVFAERLVGKPYLLLEIDRQEIARYGLHIEDVQDVIEIAVGGKISSQTVEGRERFNVRIRYPRELRNSPEALEDIYVKTPTNGQIPLKNFVKIKYEKGSQAIKSEDTFLVGYVLFDKQDDFAEVSVVENAQNEIENLIQTGELKVPKGISFDFTGTYENQLRAEATLQIIVPLVLVIIFIILYFQFQSIPVSLMVFSGIAVALSGGFMLLWLYGQDWFMNFDLFGINLRDLFHIKTINMSVAVWIGFIALFGIATDDGVVMATYLSQTFKRNNPKNKQEIRESVIEAGQKRIRPCLMTTATTLLALLPILTASGRGSDIMIPMAIPAFGGMLIALISLFVVPVLFSLYQERRLKFINKK